MTHRDLLADLRYRLELDLTAREDGATSRTEIRFGCTSPGSTTHADLDLARVTRIELNGRVLPLSSWRDGRVALPPLDAENVLRVEGVAAFASGGVGLCTFVDDAGERFIYLNLQPSSAPAVMCCFVGAGRVGLELTVVAPGGWTVHSQTPPAERPRAGAAGPWRFVPPLPVDVNPTFAAGPWASDRDVHARPSQHDLLASSAIGEVRDAVFAHHERVLGVADPFAHRPCVLVPGYGNQATNSGGIVVCHERVLHGSVEDEWRAYVLWVLAHEAAHSWFGATFERRAPEDAWLYEGIATYLCHRAMDELAPELAPWARFHVLEEAEAHDIDVSPDAHAITAVPPGATRGLAPLVYGKPAAVLRQLERVIGRDAVDHALGRLVRDHGSDVVDTSDFVRAVETAAGADLSAWMEDWLHEPGVNTLTIERAEDGDTVVRQTAPTPGGRLRTHRITVRAFDAAGDALVPRAPIDLTVFGASTPVPQLSRSAPPDLVVLNAPASSYVRVRLDDRSRATLASHLSALPVDVRAVCWVASLGMAKEGLLAIDELRSLVVAHAGAEPDPLVRSLLATAAGA